MKKTKKITEIKFWDNKNLEIRTRIEKINKSVYFKNLSKKSFWWDKYLGQFRNKAILNVGCGFEDLIPYWIKSKNFVIGLDISSETIINNKLLFERLQINKHDYELIIADAEKLPLKSKKFDMIFIKWLLHHVDSLDDVLGNLNNFLKEDGVLIITETNYLYPFRRIVQSDFLKHLNPFRRYVLKNKWMVSTEKALTPNQYIDALNRNGFEIKFIEYDCSFFKYLGNLLFWNVRLDMFLSKLDRFVFKIIPKFYGKDVRMIVKLKNKGNVL